MMKKRNFETLGIILVLMLTVLLTGCGAEQEQTSIEEEYDVLDESLGNENKKDMMEYSDKYQYQEEEDVNQ